MIEVKVKLRDARAQLRLSQVRLAELAEVHEATVVAAEKGGTLRRTTAYALLDALNAERASRNLDALKLDDLDWNIQG